MIFTTRARTADDAAGDQTTRTNVIRTENTRRRGIRMKYNEFTGYITLHQVFDVIPSANHFDDYNDALEYLNERLQCRLPHKKAIGCILNSKLEVLYKTEVEPDD